MFCDIATFKWNILAIPSQHIKSLGKMAELAQSTNPIYKYYQSVPTILWC